MRSSDYNGMPRYVGSSDEIILGDEGFTVHRNRSNRRTYRRWEYVTFTTVEPANGRKKNTLRIVQKRLASVLIVAFDTVEEANEVKEAIDARLGTRQGD